MKTLKTIQTLSKIGKVLSKIMFIFCIVGFCGCIVGILSMVLGAPTLKFGGVTLESILNTEAEVTVGTVYAAMAVGTILCAGEVNLGYIMEALFSTPFGTGYPMEEAERKRKDAELLKRIRNHANVPLLRFLKILDQEIVRKKISRDIVTGFILEKGINAQIVEFVKEYKHE